MVRRPAVGAVNRNDVLEAGLPERHAVQDGFGDEQRLIGLGRRAVEHSPARAWQVKVVRLVATDAAAVNAGDVAGRVEQRNGDTAPEVLLAFLIQHAQRLQAVNDFTGLGQDTGQGAVAVANLEHFQHGRVIQLPGLEIIQANPVLVQGLRIEADNPLQEPGCLPRRQHGRGGLRRCRCVSTGRLQRAGRLHSGDGLAELQGGFPVADAFLPGNELDDVASGSTTGAVPQPLVGRHNERGGFVLVEATPANVVAPGPFELHPVALHHAHKVRGPFDVVEVQFHRSEGQAEPLRVGPQIAPNPLR